MAIFSIVIKLLSKGKKSTFLLAESSQVESLYASFDNVIHAGIGNEMMAPYIADNERYSHL